MRFGSKEFLFRKRFSFLQFDFQISKTSSSNVQLLSALDGHNQEEANRLAFRNKLHIGGEVLAYIILFILFKIILILLVVVQIFHNKNKQ